ncbi:YIP1 family protein [archaeon]
MLEFGDMISAFKSETGAKSNAEKYKGQTSLVAGIVNTLATMFINTVLVIIGLLVFTVVLSTFSPVSAAMLLPQVVGTIILFFFGIIFWLIGDSLAFVFGKMLGGTGDYGHFMGAISYPEGAGRILTGVLGLIPLVGGLLGFVAALWALNMSAKTIESVHNIGPWQAVGSIIVAAVVIIGGMMIVGIVLAPILALLGFGTAVGATVLGV